MLVFHEGSIGDTIIIVPILRALRKKFPDEKIVLLHDSVKTGCRELLDGSGYVDEFISFPCHKNRLVKTFGMLKLMWALRKKHFAKGIYLLRSSPLLPVRVGRDKLFFRLCGIREMIGMQKIFRFPEPTGRGTPPVPHQLALLNERLRADGFEMDLTDPNAFDLHLTEKEKQNVRAWRERMETANGGRRPVAVCMSGKSFCLWPLGKYAETLKILWDKAGIYPIFFGGEESRADVAAVLKKIPSGSPADAFGKLSLREIYGALAVCAFYLGNDTGILHLAVAAKIRCVAIFSAHNYRGLWYPWGNEHKVIRKNRDCECCYPENCCTGIADCLKEISVPEVVYACEEILAGEEKK